MDLPVRERGLPGRIAAGGYILHAGLEQWQGDTALLLAVVPGLITGGLGDRRIGS